MNPFETETMAELCLRQGHREEALAIYRRLVARTSDHATRRRLSERLSALVAGQPHARALQMPGVRAHLTDHALTIEWRLPEATRSPALEVLLVKRRPTGVETERRAFEVGQTSGSLTLDTVGLHSARVAAGVQGPRGFVPLARG